MSEGQPPQIPPPEGQPPSSENNLPIQQQNLYRRILTIMNDWLRLRLGLSVDQYPDKSGEVRTKLTLGIAIDTKGVGEKPPSEAPTSTESPVDKANREAKQLAQIQKKREDSKKGGLERQRRRRELKKTVKSDDTSGQPNTPPESAPDSEEPPTE